MLIIFLNNVTPHRFMSLEMSWKFVALPSMKRLNLGKWNVRAESTVMLSHSYCLPPLQSLHRKSVWLPHLPCSFTQEIWLKMNSTCSLNGPRFCLMHANEWLRERLKSVTSQGVFTAIIWRHSRDTANAPVTWRRVWGCRVSVKYEPFKCDCEGTRGLCLINLLEV